MTDAAMCLYTMGVAIALAGIVIVVLYYTKNGKRKHKHHSHSHAVSNSQRTRGAERASSRRARPAERRAAVPLNKESPTNNTIQNHPQGVAVNPQSPPPHGPVPANTNSNNNNNSNNNSGSSRRNNNRSQQQQQQPAQLESGTTAAAIAALEAETAGYKQVQCEIVEFARGADGSGRGTHPHIPPTTNGQGAVAVHKQDSDDLSTTSTNWSGYVAQDNLTTPTTGAVTFVYGRWKIPTLAPSLSDTFSSMWVGIDGFSSPTVEQIGSESDWDSVNNVQVNFVWFEMYPLASNEIVGFPANAGDEISAYVHNTGSGVFAMRVHNHTQRVVYNVPTTMTTNVAALSNSAEWIMEAPFSGSILPLANFDHVKFSHCKVTINGHEGHIGRRHSWQHESINMVTGGSPSLIKASTGRLHDEGSEFKVTWAHT